MITAILDINYHSNQKPEDTLTEGHNIKIIDEDSRQSVTIDFLSWYDASAVLISMGSNAEDITTKDLRIEK